MYYVFSNWDELKTLLEQKKFQELAEEFQKTEILEQECWRYGMLSTKEAYRYICDAVSKKDKNALASINKKGLELFSRIWDVDSLLMIKGEKNKFGALDEAAKKILQEYNYYRVLAVKELELHPQAEGYKKEVDDVVITINRGRVSFFRAGREYIIFHAEDF